ncbi:serine/threonine protein kinase [Myceligenerans sp. TRM 65318]|uniref:non-specific serine/threonine protein kinase n=1 Tax=Myceligenerans pegani TaxID=2776917 RepID=A0ABR9N5C6_9MICO|nr:serine/threonine protein kinase [Myceligenerans sp. TRM 65318]MBE3020662.1 serine/threonine protein kinase [Myceligenerans sp. TRM 65318]
MHLLSAGQRVGEACVVERPLGQGAYSEVYRVRHRILGRLAMKVFKRVGTFDETRRLLGEAVLLSQLGHPNVVRVFDAGTVPTRSGERGWFTMEYVAGGNLDDFRQSYTAGPVPVDDAVEVLVQVCAGLAVAHQEDPPVVHRDLTPWNILVGTGPRGLRARIGDFGLARSVDPVSGLAPGDGTLAFMPPEALRFGAGTSTAGDVYSVGVIAYLLLTDVLPYPDVALTTFGAARRVAPVAPARFNRAVDHGLERIVLRALDPEPARRFRDAAELGAELAAWQRERSTGRATPDQAPPERRHTA